MKNKPLKILFDANPMVSSQKSGVGYFTSMLIDSVAKYHPEEIMLVGHYFNFLGRKHPALPQHPNIKYVQSKVLPGKVLSVCRRFGFQLPFELLIKTSGDIALFPNYISLPTIKKIKKIVVFHDLCYTEFPEYLQVPNRNFLQKFAPDSIKSASLVVAVSESTKTAIIKNYSTDRGKIFVAPIPPEAPLKTGKRPNIDIPKKYILFVGTLEPRKNFIALARAYALLNPVLKKDCGLVLAGKYGWNVDDEIKEIDRLNEQGENIVITGYISDEERAYLYKSASLLALPSHYEGFGMPLLEAMSYGLPVAASDIPVFREVAGEAALYFDKDNPKAIAKSIENILSSVALQNKLNAAAKLQLKKYDWNKIAKDFIENLRDV